MKLSRHFLQLAALAALAVPVFAQQPGYPPANPQNYPQNNYPQNNYPPPPQGNAQAMQPGEYPHFPNNNDPAPAMVPVPPALNIPAGKYLTVRSNNLISSDHNQPGDFFSATLVEPLVVDGFVVAARGQVVNGRVVDVQKAGRVKGVSSLRVELTELNLVDGQQIPLRTQMIYRQGPTSVGRDVAAVGETTAVGAAIGAAATGSGLYAGVGALAGAAAATIGVLSTRGRPTILAPESLLTFRVEQPITISTVRSPGAFTTVARDDYAQPHRQQFQGGPGYGYGGPAVAGYPYAYPYYGYYGAPFYSGLYFYGGPRYYGYYGRGWGRRW